MIERWTAVGEVCELVGFWLRKHDSLWQLGRQRDHETQEDGDCE